MHAVVGLSARARLFGYAGLLALALPVIAATNETPVGQVSTSIQIVVTARKWSEPVQDVPGAVTVRSSDDLAAANARSLRDAAKDVPNLTLANFTTRQFTFPYVRGIGSGQNDPGVATYIDGVPQLSYVTANQELLDVDRVEFLRGPQGALYGSDSMGGVINFVPRVPSAVPGGYITLSGGNYDAFGVRVGAEGPLGDSGLLGSFSGGYSTRDGYTKNDVTGHDLDSQKDYFGRAQVYLPDQGRWDFRFSVTAEHDRDGDYALYDLDSIRAHPYHASHDYEGYNDRDLFQPVFTAQRHGDAADFTSITAFQWWRTHDSTDLDYTSTDLMRQYVNTDDYAGIEELRLASPTDAPVKLSDHVDMHWLVGAFGFAEKNTQRTTTDYSPLALFLGMGPAPQTEKDAQLDNLGASLFGQATFTLDKKWELGLGVRDDFEHRSADMTSMIPPSTILSSSSPSRDFNQACPSASLSYHFTPDILAYAKVAEGYRAGGFNAVGPASYDPEKSWNYEIGLKTMWFDRTLTANLALFKTIWHDMQLDEPFTPPQYFIDNAGDARSQGAELELTERLCDDVKLFAGGGLLDSDFHAGSSAMSFGPPPFYPMLKTDVGGNDLPFAPRVTWHAGAEYSHAMGTHLRGFARAEITGTSRYYFDPINGASQGAMELVNVSVGVAAGNWRVEAWVRNLLDRDYVVLALPNPGLAPSGYIGENGAPCTFGMSLTRTF
jgi:iron complex outermembrane receptor protein